MNVIIKADYIVKTKPENLLVNHSLNLSVHNSVINNNRRLVAHCSSLGRKTYGTGCNIIKITNSNGDILYEK